MFQHEFLVLVHLKDLWRPLEGLERGERERASERENTRERERERERV